MRQDNRPLRVLIVDDDPDIQDVISLCIELNWPGAMLIHAPEGKSGIDQFLSGGADLVVLDLGLPDIDGLTVCTTIRAESKVPIVMVTARGQESDVINGLNAGADDYILKPFSRGEFIARLTAVLRRAGALEPAAQFEDRELKIDFETKHVSRNGEPIRLNVTEFALLERLVSRRGTVVTNRDLLEAGWGAEYAGADAHLDMVMEGLARKVGGDSGKTGIVRSPGIGYRYIPVA